MGHLLFHKTPNSMSSEPAAAQIDKDSLALHGKFIGRTAIVSYELVLPGTYRAALIVRNFRINGCNVDQDGHPGGLINAGNSAEPQAIARSFGTIGKPSADLGSSKTDLRWRASWPPIGRSQKRGARSWSRCLVTDSVRQKFEASYHE